MFSFRLLKARLLTALLCLAVLFLTVTGGLEAVQADKQASFSSKCSRIVSLAPSITEVVIALGLAERLVGVTRYCKLPAGSSSQPAVVGGYLDLSLEQLVRVEPSLVISLVEHEQIRDNLTKLKIDQLVVEHRGIHGIRSSITKIAAECGARERGMLLLQQIDQRVARIAQAIQGVTPVRTLVAVGRTETESPLGGIFISGNDGFYSDLLGLAGGVNVLEGATIPLPSISAEGLVALNPDLIIEIAPQYGKETLPIAEIRKSWSTLPMLKAVQEGRIQFFSGDSFVRPGPNYPDVAEQFARALHPGRFNPAAKAAVEGGQGHE